MPFGLGSPCLFFPSPLVCGPRGPERPGEVIAGLVGVGNADQSGAA